MNHWLDQQFRRWARWHELRLRDKSMGWPSSSPITHFGMPRSGSVWSGHDLVEDWSDCEELHEALKIWVKKEKLGSGEYCLLFTYYVETHCSYRKTGKSIGATDKTIKGWLDLVLLKVDRLLAEKSTVQKQLDIYTVVD